MIVYVIVCSETLKIYIGQHSGPDLQKYLAKKWYAAHHFGVRSHLYAAMRKYPRESWSIHPLVVGIETKPELDETERLLIYALKTQHPDVGYNICDGGEGFTGPHTEEWKQKTSARQMGHPDYMTPEGREKVLAFNAQRKGKKLSPDHCIKISLAQKQRLAGGGKHVSGMQGRKHSPETLAKMQAAAAGRVISPEQRQKLSAAHMGHPWSAKRRAAYNKTFSTISEASGAR